MPLTERFPAVVHLQVTLENFQREYFKASIDQHVANAEPLATSRTSFFNQCVTDDFARKILFADIPKYYTRNASTKTWQKKEVVGEK